MTFLLGLVAGLIIGWVVEWIIDWQFWRSEASESVSSERQLREELDQAQAEIAALNNKRRLNNNRRRNSKRRRHSPRPLTI